MKTENNNINVMADESFADGFHINTIIDGMPETFAIAYAPVSWANALTSDEAHKEKCKNAKLIVTAVNNHYKLIEALKDILMNCYTYDNGMKHVPDAFINSAKELLKQIEQQ